MNSTAYPPPLPFPPLSVVDLLQQSERVSPLAGLSLSIALSLGLDPPPLSLSLSLSRMRQVMWLECQQHQRFSKKGRVHAYFLQIKLP